MGPAIVRRVLAAPTRVRDRRFRRRDGEKARGRIRTIVARTPRAKRAESERRLA